MTGLQIKMSDTNYDVISESLYEDYWPISSPAPTSDVTSPVVVLTTVVKATAMLAVVMATLLGNTLVIVGVWRSDKLRSSVANAFIVSLAGADLMVALLVMPFSALQVKLIIGEPITGDLISGKPMRSEQISANHSVIISLALAVDTVIVIIQIVTDV